MELINTKLIIFRFKGVVGIKTDDEFANYLKIKRETLSSWKKRNAPDFELLIRLSMRNNINIHWLLTGEGEMLTNKAETTQTLKCPHCNKPLQITIG